MGREKLSHGFMKSIALLAALTALFCLSAPRGASAVAVTARKAASGDEAIIEGLKLHQVGSNQIMMELRGTKMPLPTVLSTEQAAKLAWEKTRFPRDTDRKKWWDEFEGEVVKVDLKKSDNWTQTYEYPLIERITVTSYEGRVVMDIIGPKRLNLKNISGLPGADRFRLMFEAPSDIAPPLVPPKRPAPKGDPLTISTPVTLELRDVSAREVFRLLAKLDDLNLVLDASVPDTPVTFSFQNARFGEVFAYMLRMNDLSYSLVGKTLVVGTPESVGKTLGQNVTRQYKVAYGDVAKMPAIVMGLVPLPKPPVVDERLRCLYVTATPEQHRRVETLMNRLDHPGQQVMIEARLVEITDTARQEIESMISAVYRGWIFTYGATGASSRYTYGNGLIAPNLNPTGSSSNSGSVPIIGTDSSSIPVSIVDPAMKMLDAGLRAMESDNKGKILASPSVVALDGQKASVRLTHNYLYQSGLDDDGNPEFSNQETGPTLEFTPMLGRDGFITIKMKISAGEIVTFRRSGSSEAPETTKREVDTQARVRNGEIFVIGGLYQDNRSNSVTRVPILGYIPLLGELFKSRTTSHVRSQLAFIAIPYILDIPTGEAEVLEMAGSSLYQ